MTKNTRKKLLILFLSILGIKVLTSFLMNGPITFPDEACVNQRAMFFLENLKIETCHNITNLDSGDTFPLYSILISPIYLFFSNKSAYFATLILNSILISTLVFPLFNIFKKFIKKENTALLFTGIILFSSQTLTYEKMIMTEALFIFLNIWLLYFYLNSFKKNKNRNKFIAIIFAVLAALTRPFGFISLLSIGINEFILSRKKREVLITFLPISIVLIALPFLLLPNSLEGIVAKFSALKDFANWKYILIALKNQANTFSVATFFIPLIIFISHINKKNTPALKSIKGFILAFITLNFIISAQHIFGYYLNGKELELLTRYLNISIIFVFIFSLIFIEKYKKIDFNKTTIISTIILTTSLLFSGIVAKHAQNPDISLFYSYTRTPNNWIGPHLEIAPIIYLLPIILILSILAISKKTKIYISTLLITIITFSALNLGWLIKYPYESSLLKFFLEKENQKITYILNKNKPELIDAWKILSITNNKIEFQLINNPQQINLQANTDYFITQEKLNLPLELDVNEYKLYKANNDQK